MTATGRRHGAIDASPEGDGGGDRDGGDFASVYQAWFEPVCRWLRALGGPQSDVEDLAQEVFMVVRRKLPGFDGRNMAGWLYRISARTASDARRRAWWKHLLRGRGLAAIDELAHGGAGPVELLERKEAERVVYALLDRMSDKRRRALILAELEGCSGAEIAALEGIPEATVRTRLHHARRDFLALARQHRRGEAP
jgi:RNA polymerase sigma-70 factor (ECF subfamily)